MVSECPGRGAGVPWRRSDEALRVNVGGVRRCLSARALARFPGTRLGRLQAAASEEQARRLCDDYDATAREFYFDRHPGFFLGLLHFYRTGRLHVLDELCVFAFGQEADYWGLGESALAACCRGRYLERRVARPRAWDEDSDTPSSVDPCPDEISDVQRELARYGAARCGRLRRRLWLTMENPGYSLPSKLFSCVSIGVVLASIAAMCIHSLPEYQAREAAAAVAAVAAGRSAEEARDDDPVLRRLEYFCIAWFSFEVSSRLLLAPSTRNFFCHPLNLIDIVSVLPFYLTLLAGVALGDRRGAGGEELGDLGKVVQVFRLMRIFRVLKLARHSTGLRSLGATLKHSYREVGILLLYLAVGVSVFSGVAYTAEKEEDVGFDTIPACWWWGTVSMTTVGYGDVVPVTVVGKLAASGCILGGILVVALPITIIFNKFSHFYRRQKALEAAVRNSDHRHFEDLLSSVDGVSEASLETSREASREGQFADLETQPPGEPPDSGRY
ncbi:potassium voltage-gated channel subfamily S member 1 [Ochotona princeps]|uniref:potassium voltage-gated channel subfamily S member 1 n=1 Tax=Ochotona princeps TaxID=9978 RepID=UPI00032B0EF2|nr:potassium voltage-gated channel subfamily S member 1 [Ochotona princeps]